METQRMFCPQCNHQVELVSTESVQQDGQATLPDPELACLCAGAECEAPRCPVLSLPPVVVRSRLARHGLGDNLPRVHATCASCDRVTDMIVIGAGYRWCTECGATAAADIA